jgi:hypothetical protein
MKKTILILISLLISTSVFAKDYQCNASKSSRWQTASVGILVNGAQYLYHVRASGIYLAADLICDFTGKCVGFTGGVGEVKGQLQFTKRGPLEVVGVTFQTKGVTIPAGRFSCH